MRPVRSILNEFARRWTDRRVRRQAEVSDFAGVREVKRLTRPKPPAPYRPKPRSDVISHL